MSTLRNTPALLASAPAALRPAPSIATTLVTRSILKPGHYTGIFPIDDNAAWEKNAATLKQLHKMRERLKALEKKT